MNLNHTIVYITSRFKPNPGWLVRSLAPQLEPNDLVRIIIVDALYANRPGWFNDSLENPVPAGISVRHVAPKPTVWQGEHRKTKEDWWAASNARNTGICLCATEWISFLDDRCALIPSWLDGVRRAIAGNYVACGAYMKVTGMKFNGRIPTHSAVIGVDSRYEWCKLHKPGETIVDAPGEWTYGCSITLPLQWALAVNGFDETCDGASHEDSMFGLMLANNGYPIKYDMGMWMVEDRTPEFSKPVMRREDKGVSPNDKSHFLLNLLRGRKSALHPINLTEIRQRLAVGEPWPAPWGPEKDPFDGQPISEM